MNQPKIVIQPQSPELSHTPLTPNLNRCAAPVDSAPPSPSETSNGHDGAVNGHSYHRSQDSVKSADASENNSLEESNNYLGSKQNGDFHSRSSFDASDDDQSLQTSTSLNHGGGDLSDNSDSHSTKSSEIADGLTKPKDKRKKKNRISQMIAGVSNKSKSELFQKLFKNMAPDELLVSDYSCALQRDILVHGRLYLSQTWLCFYANIFGWETLVTIRWVDITAITKEKTAKLIPNAIQLFTETDKYFFSTFVTREHAYTALFRIWQNALLGQPVLPADLKSICKRKTASGSRGETTREGTPLIDDNIDETGDEMLENNYDDNTSMISSESLGAQNNTRDIDSSCKLESSTNDVFNDDRSKHSVASSPSDSPRCGAKYATSSIDPSQLLDKDAVDNAKSKPVPIISANVNMNSTSIIEENASCPEKSEVNGSEDKLKNIKLSSSSPLPSVQVFASVHHGGRKNRKPKQRKRTNYPPYHLKVPNLEAESTSDNDSEDEPILADRDDDVLCPCHDNHKGCEYINEEFNFDVDALYEHLFSQDSDMMKTVFTKRKFQHTKYTPFKREDDGSHSQLLSYTIPLNYSIGPKQCNTSTKHIMPNDNTPGSFYIIKTESTTTGIPYGDSFYVSTQYCITRASGNRSRLRITSDIVYTKKVFGLVKNMISRGSDEAFRDYTGFLLDILKSESDLLSYKSITPPKAKPAKSKSCDVLKPLSEAVPMKTTVGEDCSAKTVVTKKESRKKSLAEMTEVTEAKKSPLRTFIFVLSILLLMNMYMMSRLRALESSVLVSRETPSWLPEKVPTTKEEWNYLLDYQKSLHELELLKLKEVIGNTASLLEQVQLSMRMLYNNVEKNLDEVATKTASNPDPDDAAGKGQKKGANLRVGGSESA